jgi:hypothetical protein
MAGQIPVLAAVSRFSKNAPIIDLQNLRAARLAIIEGKFIPFDLD